MARKNKFTPVVEVDEVQTPPAPPPTTPHSIPLALRDDPPVTPPEAQEDDANAFKTAFDANGDAKANAEPDAKEDAAQPNEDGDAKEDDPELVQLLKRRQPKANVATNDAKEDAAQPKAKDDNPEPADTPANVQLLSALEAAVKQGLRDGFAGLRTIRDRCLWKLIKDDLGDRKFKTFANYMDDHWGHTTQWATQGIKWVTILEGLESIGVKSTIITVDAAQQLDADDAAENLEILRECKEANLPFNSPNLRELRRRRERFAAGDMKAKTYEGFCADWQSIKKLGDDSASWSFDLVRRAQAVPGDLAQNLLDLAKPEGLVPNPNDLLVQFTGDELATIVQSFETAVTMKADLLAKKKEFAMISQKATKLRHELIAAGEIKPRRKPGDEGDGDGETQIDADATTPPADATPPIPTKQLQIVVRFDATCDSSLNAADFMAALNRHTLTFDFPEGYDVRIIPEGAVVNEINMIDGTESLDVTDPPAPLDIEL